MIDWLQQNIGTIVLISGPLGAFLYWSSRRVWNLITWGVEVLNRLRTVEQDRSANKSDIKEHIEECLETRAVITGKIDRLHSTVNKLVGMVEVLRDKAD